MKQTFHHMRRGLIQAIFTYQLNQILRVLLISFRRIISITVWSRLSVILMGMFFVFSGCEEQVNEEMTMINLPLLDLSIIRICSDGEDNDGDDLIDLDDPGCVGELDDDEFNVLPPTECSDQVDNDNDGLVDLEDPACLDPRGEDESNDPPLPECQNQLDDDEDGYVDYPSDPGCQTDGDEDEGDDPPPSECQNLIDDDQDGYADYPFDPGCASPEDDDERDDTMFSNIPQCNNGLDDDQDGYADLADVDCLNLTDPRERVIEGDPIPVCANDLDDDEDGYTDFPQDIGCSSAEKQKGVAVRLRYQGDWREVSGYQIIEEGERQYRIAYLLPSMLQEIFLAYKISEPIKRVFEIYASKESNLFVLGNQETSPIFEELEEDVDEIGGAEGDGSSQKHKRGDAFGKKRY